MSLYEKNNDTITKVSFETLASRAPGYYVLFDAMTSSHYIYLIEYKMGDRKLWKIRVKKDVERYHIESIQMGYNHSTGFFDKITDNGYIKFRLNNNSFFINDAISDLNDGDTSLANALRLLDENDLLDSENYKAVQTHPNPHIHAKMLVSLHKLKQAKILVENREAVLAHHKPAALAEALLFLLRENIYTPENRLAVIAHQNPRALAETLQRMHIMNISNMAIMPDILAVLMASQFPFSLISKIDALNIKNILTPEVLKIIINHPNADRLINALALLKQANIFNSENCSILSNLKQIDVERYARVMIILNDANLLSSEENRNAVFNHLFPEHLAKALGILNMAGILTEKNRELLIAYPWDSLSFSDFSKMTQYFLDDALILLQPATMLTEHFDAVIEHPKPYSFAQALLLLQQANLLTEHYEAVKNHLNPDALAKAILKLHQANLFTEYYELVKHHSRPEDLAESLVLLKKENIDSKENDTTLQNSAYPLSKANDLISKEISSYSCLIETSSMPHVFKEDLKTLRKNGMLKTYRNVLFSHQNPASLANALILLRKEHLDNADFIQAVIDQQDPASLAIALSNLKETPLYEEYVEAVLKHPFPDSFVLALVMLKEEQILSPENYETVFNHKDPESIAKVLVSLKKAPQLFVEHRAAVLEHPDPASLPHLLNTLQALSMFDSTFFKIVVNPQTAGMVSSLQAAGILNSDNLRLIAEHQDVVRIVQILNILQTTRLLNQQNLEWVLKHQDLPSLITALDTLNKTKLLNMNSFNTVLEHQDLYSFACTLKELHENRILDADNFKVMTDRADCSALATAMILLRKNTITIRSSGVQSCVPPNMLTQENKSALMNHKDPIALAKALIVLQNSDILDANREMVINHQYLDELLTILVLLKKANILIEQATAVFNHQELPLLAQCMKLIDDVKITDAAILKVAIHHPHLPLLTHVLNSLAKVGISNEETFRLAIYYPDLYLLADLLESFAELHIVDAEVFRIAIHHPHLPLLVDALKSLMDLGIDTQILKEIIKHRTPLIFVDLVKLLHEYNLRDSETIEAASKHLDFSLLMDVLKTVHTIFESEVEVLKEVVDSKSIISINNALNILKNADLLTHENCKTAIRHQAPDQFAKGLILLHEARLLNSDYREALVNHATPLSFANALSSLHAANLLVNTQNIDFIANTPKPYYPQSFLNAENVKAVLMHKEPLHVANALISLRKAGIMTTRYIDEVIKQPQSYFFATALETLLKAQILNPDNFTTLLRREDGQAALAVVLSELSSAKLLTNDTRERMAQHHNIFNIAEALKILNNASRLNEANFDAVIKHEFPIKHANELASKSNVVVVSPKPR